jgi:ATP-binding cassette, subfamily B, bacterial
MTYANWRAMHSFSRDPSVARQKLKPGTVRRVLSYAKPYRWDLFWFLLIVALDAVVTIAVPLLLRSLIDQGILPRDRGVVIAIGLIVGALALFDAVLSLAQRWFSAKIGEGLIYDLRTQVFSHVQQQPIAFFTRTQTGSLVSRLNSDVIGAQQALTSTLSSVVANVLSLALVAGAMILLSWQVTVIALVLIPAFIFPARWVGRKLQRLTRESMQLDAAMGSTMTERFNVAGAMLVKLFGRPSEEIDTFGGRAGRVRDIGVTTAMYGSALVISLTLLASLATAVVYGLGGVLVIDNIFKIGTLVALAALISRLYGPITSLSNVQVDVMTALVSFDRVFEVLDLKPLITDADDATDLAVSVGQEAPAIDFEQVSFRYPTASEISLASLESIALAVPEHADQNAQVLNAVSFHAPAGKLTALVGPSGAGKTTITQLVARLYDPNDGAVKIGGTDVKTVTQDSLHQVVGVVTQDAHMFHDTIRSNLTYAKPGATQDELIEACRAAQIWPLISSLPDGLDTIVGDRGYRLSGGEKQRIALARLLLKAPSVVVLDEATAHLDSESEVAVQRALKTALADRTSLVIAHRLSTIVAADQILVIDGGHVVERGTHAELLAVDGLYRDLYQTQFAQQAGAGPHGQAATGSEAAGHAAAQPVAAPAPA